MKAKAGNGSPGKPLARGKSLPTGFRYPRGSPVKCALNQPAVTNLLLQLLTQPSLGRVTAERTRPPPVKIGSSGFNSFYRVIAQMQSVPGTGWGSALEKHWFPPEAQVLLFGTCCRSTLRWVHIATSVTSKYYRMRRERAVLECLPRARGAFIWDRNTGSTHNVDQGLQALRLFKPSFGAFTLSIVVLTFSKRLQLCS